MEGKWKEYRKENERKRGRKMERKRGKKRIRGKKERERERVTKKRDGWGRMGKGEM